MLSILIPAYNVDLRHLVRDLLRQCRQLGLVFEVLVEDDASDAKFHRFYEDVAHEPEVTLLTNEVNQGRSKVRNHLADTARYPYLLFMDCDANVKMPDYISQYLQCIRSKSVGGKPFVVSGGLAYREQMPDEEHRLRWKYGVRREVRTAARRNLKPYAAFTPFNMLISKEVFQYCHFDESISTYGFEDTLFGYQLQLAQIPMDHIDNELFHDGIDDNALFLKKVETSITNLVRLYRSRKLPDSFIQNSRLMRTYAKCEHYHLIVPVHKLLNVCEKLLRHSVLKKSSLWALDLLKMKFLCDRMGVESVTD